MGLLEKLKNTFFEEEYVEVEEPEKPKKEKKPVAKKIEPKEELPVSKPTPVVPEREEVVEEKEEPVIFTEKELTKHEVNFKYFDDDDFVDIEDETTLKNKKPVEEAKPYEGVKQPYGGTKLYDNPEYGTTKPYNNTVPYSKDKSGFKPTPIISPIYGVLDKNYKKEEIVDKKEVQKKSSYVSRKNVDLDTVRQKAFGELSHDLGLSNDMTVTLEETEEDSLNPLEDNLLYDMSDIDPTPKVEKVTIADAEEYFQDLGLEYNIDYKDVKYEKATGRRVRNQPELDDIEEDSKEEEAVVKTQKEFVPSKEETNLEDNLFDLIDSMYEEKE